MSEITRSHKYIHIHTRKQTNKQTPVFYLKFEKICDGDKCPTVLNRLKLTINGTEMIGSYRTVLTKEVAQITATQFPLHRIMRQA